MIAKVYLTGKLADAFQQKLERGGYKTAELTRIALREYLGVDEVKS